MRLELLVLSSLVLLSVGVMVDYVVIVVDHMSSSLVHLTGVVLLPCQLVSVVLRLMVLSLIDVVLLRSRFTTEIPAEGRSMARLLAFFGRIFFGLRHGQKVSLNGGYLAEAASTVRHFGVLFGGVEVDDWLTVFLISDCMLSASLV